LRRRSTSEAISAAKNIYGDALVIADNEVGNFIDEIAPTAKVETGDNAGEIKLIFSEAVKAKGGDDDDVNLLIDAIMSELLIKTADGKDTLPVEKYSLEKSMGKTNSLSRLKMMKVTSRKN
jgi:hypothetical protein